MYMQVVVKVQFWCVFTLLLADGVDARPSSPHVENGEIPEVGMICDYMCIHVLTVQVFFYIISVLQ